MLDVKTEISNQIVMKMYQDVGHELAKKLEGIIYMVLADFNIERASTELEVYKGDVTTELIKRFIVSKKLKNCSDRTLKYYTTESMRIFETIGKNPIDATVDDIRMYFFKRQIEDKVSPVTINNERRVLSSFYKWMNQEDVRMSNPMLKIDEIKEPKKKKKAFTEYEIELMRNQIVDIRNKAIFEILVSTWARVSEIAEIKLSDIQEDQVLVHGKGDKYRYVFLTPKAQLAIKEYLDRRQDENCYLFTRKKDDLGGTIRNWWMFPEYVDESRHIDVGTIELFIRKLGKKNGIAAHPHKFRRTGATMALKKGMPLMTVSKTLGHESIDTTQIYLDIDETDLKEAHMKYC